MDNKDHCLFCRIYKNKDGVVYENKYFFVQFDRFPVSPGHAEIIPKRHVASVFDLMLEEWESLQYILIFTKYIIEETDFRKLYVEFARNPLNAESERLCKEALRHPGLEKTPDGYNVGINEGEAAGRTIHHLHIHIIPRYLGDVENPVGGVRNIIPGKGDYTKK